MPRGDAGHCRVRRTPDRTGLRRVGRKRARRIVGFTRPVAGATVTNPLTHSFTAMVVTAIAFDGAGRIIGGGQRTYAVGPHDTLMVYVQMTVSTRIQEITRLEVTAAYPVLDLTPYHR